LERIIANSSETKIKKVQKSGEKIILEIPVMGGSGVDGKKIKNITWPEQILIVSIRRGEDEHIPDGNCEIFSGDCLVILVDKEEAPLVKEELLKITEN
jgi:Trk K+ transport system NAD-binding subunit